MQHFVYKSYKILIYNKWITWIQKVIAKSAILIARFRNPLLVYYIHGVYKLARSSEPPSLHVNFNSARRRLISINPKKSGGLVFDNLLSIARHFLSIRSRKQCELTFQIFRKSAAIFCTFFDWFSIVNPTTFLYEFWLQSGRVFCSFQMSQKRMELFIYF